jgi:hypothetical protein
VILVRNGWPLEQRRENARKDHWGANRPPLLRTQLPMILVGVLALLPEGLTFQAKSRKGQDGWRAPGTRDTPRHRATRTQRIIEADLAPIVGFAWAADLVRTERLRRTVRPTRTAGWWRIVGLTRNCDSIRRRRTLGAGWELVRRQ